jgi:hypothetical protein
VRWPPDAAPGLALFPLARGSQQDGLLLIPGLCRPLEDVLQTIVEAGCMFLPDHDSHYMPGSGYLLVCQSTNTSTAFGLLLTR